MWVPPICSEYFGISKFWIQNLSLFLASCLLSDLSLAELTHGTSLAERCFYPLRDPRVRRDKRM